MLIREVGANNLGILNLSCGAVTSVANYEGFASFTGSLRLLRRSSSISRWPKAFRSDSLSAMARHSEKPGSIFHE